MKAAILGLVVVACSGASPPDGTVPESSVPTGSQAFVVAVLDGDSIAVVLAGRDEEVRLAGINAPEPGECFADEARAALAAAATGQVTVVASDPGRDQYGRVLAYVYSGDTNLNRMMLQRGAAIASASPHELLPEFLADDEDAFGRGIGMWATGMCRPETGSGMRLVEIDFDAPGRDDENPNGEAVVIANEGHAIDVSGWVLRDESSVHRYAFPAGTMIGAGQFVLVRSGCGATADGEYYWCADGAVWNNDGDTALLIDDAGRIVSRLRYPGH